MNQNESRMELGRILTLSAAHFLNDFYSHFLPPLLPLVVDKLSLSLTLAGMSASAYSVTSSFAQLLFGILSDRTPTGYFTVLSPFVTVAFMSCIGVVSSFPMLLMALAAGGIGVAAFHPPTVSLAGRLSGSRKGLGLSIFIAGGTIGSALGPLAIVLLVSAVGLERSYLAIIPGLVLATAFLMRRSSFRRPSVDQGTSVPIRYAIGGRCQPILLLLGVVVFRSIARFSVVTFLPLLLHQRGLSIVMGGGALTIFIAAEAAGSIMSGHLSDRLGRRIVIFFTLLISVPLLFIFLRSSGPSSLVFLALAGFALMSSNSVVIAAAQELVPGSASTSSSLVMGFSWGIASMFLVFVGRLADIVGIEQALFWMAFFPLAAAGCSLGLPSRLAPAEER